jgi:hypothetical protein
MFIVRAEARTYLRGKCKCKEEADPCGMTARKATAKAEADACGMTARKATAKAEADSQRE